MCFSSLVLSRRPKIFKKRPKTLKNPLTPIGSCRELHTNYFPRGGASAWEPDMIKKQSMRTGSQKEVPPLETPDCTPGNSWLRLLHRARLKAIGVRGGNI